MLRKIFVLALIFHFGEFTNIGRVLSQFPIPGPPTTFITQTLLIIPLRPSNIQPQYNKYQPSTDGTHINERFSNNDNQNQFNQQNSNQANAATYNADSYFLNNQNSDSKVNQPQGTSKPLNQRPQLGQNPVSNGQSIYFMNEKIHPTTFRTPTNFDRTSMVTSEEYTQKPDQRPSSDSFGDQINKNNQDDISSTYPNENAGLSQSQIPFNKQQIGSNNKLSIEHYNTPDENAIIIPNMPSKVIEIIFPPTLSYDEDASTTTRASILDSIRRRTSTTTESSYNYQQK